MLRFQATGANARPFRTHHNAPDQDMYCARHRAVPAAHRAASRRFEIAASSATRGSTPPTTPSSRCSSPTRRSPTTKTSCDGRGGDLGRGRRDPRPRRLPGTHHRPDPAVPAGQAAGRRVGGGRRRGDPGPPRPAPARHPFRRRAPGRLGPRQAGLRAVRGGRGGEAVGADLRHPLPDRGVAAGGAQPGRSPAHRPLRAAHRRVRVRQRSPAQRPDRPAPPLAQAAARAAGDEERTRSTRIFIMALEYGCPRPRGSASA